MSPVKRDSKDRAFDAWDTFFKSIDFNSVGSNNPQVQDFRNLKAERALSDYDARQRFVFSAFYLLPFHAQGGVMRRLVQGWSMAPIFSAQTGSPFSPIIQVTDTTGSLEQFNRPFLTGQPLYVLDPRPSQFLTPKCSATFAGCAFLQQTTGFGNAGRNILTAPGMF